MRYRLWGFLLGVLLCLTWICTAFAAETHSITVTAYELEPGYYLCAVWDEDTLLTLFDAKVGSNGILNESVDIGDTPISGNTVKVAISVANIDSENAAPIIQTNVPVKGSSGAAIVPDNSGGNSDSDSAGGDVFDSDTSGSGSTGGGSSSSRRRGSSGTASGTQNVSVSVSSNPFDDVASDAYYYDAVLWAVQSGVTSGYGDGTFRPDTTCSRAQIMTFLWRANGSPEPNATINPFTDVSADVYYYKAVLWAVEQDITTATTSTTFSPNNGCTRAQAMTFLYRANGSPAVSGSSNFNDVAFTAYYSDAVVWAVTNSITNGTTTETFSPDNTCTRAQIVTFLWRDMVGGTDF